MKQKRRRSKYIDKDLASEVAWNAMSLYIRERDRWTCVTCGRKGTNNNIDAGHYIPATYEYYKYDERNVHAQCSRPCNKDLHGNLPRYKQFMIEKYGIDFVDEMAFKKFQMVKRTVDEYLEIERYYKDKLKQLKGE